VKQFLRRAGPRTKDSLIEAIGHGLGTITPEDARNWFSHYGYAWKAY